MKKMKTKLILKLILLLFIIITFFTIILSFFDHSHYKGIDENKDKNLINKLFNRLYFTLSTLSSASYGDIIPRSNILKMISILLQLIVIFSLITGFIGFV